MVYRPLAGVMSRRGGAELPSLKFNGVSMQNVTSIQADKHQRQQKETSWFLPGGVAGFVAWWIALAIPLMMYGSGALFLFFLYTWPFFLALLPVSVLAGVAISALLRGQVIWTALVTTLLAISLFWLLFCLLSSW
ncbi:Inner membrane protein ygbE [Erwinia sp. Ejp617]|nr:Inner membrane protein ygbE [Erwinia sp. Ejp617]